MDFTTIISSKIFIGITSAVGGIVIAIITQFILNKRGILSYHVFHNRVGLSTEDVIYGSVKVTWNETPVAHLYFSTVELINESMRDYESVEIRIYSNDTLLLSQRTEIVGSTHIPELTENYRKLIAVKENEQPTELQHKLYYSRRDFLVPTLNRGQKLLFQFLNAATSENQPSIWVDVLHKGIKCKFRKARRLIFGVPQPLASLVGTVIGIVAVILISIFITNLTIAAILSFILGLMVLLPGAYTVKLIRKIRDWIAG